MPRITGGRGSQAPRALAAASTELPFEARVAVYFFAGS